MGTKGPVHLWVVLPHPTQQWYGEVPAVVQPQQGLAGLCLGPRRIQDLGAQRGRLVLNPPRFTDTNTRLNLWVPLWERDKIQLALPPRSVLFLVRVAQV